MTAIYNPADPRYLDSSDLASETERVFEICHGCRLCFNLCPSFKTLFDSIDAQDGKVAAIGEVAKQRVVDECYQCKLCYLKCPYIPPHEWELDFPRLMMRHHAQRHAQPVKGILALKERLTNQVLGQTDLVGKAAVALEPLSNTLIGKPGSLPRRIMEKASGIAEHRLLPPYAKQRFTTWYRRRMPTQIRDPQGVVAVFPTCFIEYMNPAIGKALVAVYERNRISCSLPVGTRCCGAPFLHSGDIDRFIRSAKRNVASLAPLVRGGADVIVAQPTCAYVLRKDYPLYLDSQDARTVAEHTYDSSEYLMRLRSDDSKELDTEFKGEVPESISYHVACHLKAQGIGIKGRDLLKLTGAKVQLVQECSGIDGTWGYRSENYELSRQVAQPLKKAVELSIAQAQADQVGAGRNSGGHVLCGDCHLANTAIEQETGNKPMHPMQVLAKAYGIKEVPSGS
ncbi:MAG: heterodisulfide reductase-related iron-sulfur binding cluster [Actinobacteria bacterium]|nr:heterodisulfide reductase-related iron-sulfur binding cluster [Actinomycetota bacterium]MCL6094715.1 heterodisulfide reductase-related iron-sulfur binding cluster [Actinomycetota bacterium]